MKYLNISLTSALIICLLYLPSTTYGEPDLLRYRFLGTEDSDDLRDIFIDSNENYLMAGTTNRGAWVIKVNAAGETIWEQSWDMFNDDISDRLYSLIETDDNTILSGGTIGQLNGFVACMTEGRDGRLIWERRYGGENRGYCQSVIELKQGNFVLAGRLYVNGVRRGYIVFIDRDGNVDREVILDPEVSECVNSVLEAPGEGLFLCGNSSEDATFIKMDGNGDVVDYWSYPDGGFGTNFFSMCSVGNDYVLLRYTNRNPNGDYFSALRLRRDGSIAWVSHLGIVTAFMSCITKYHDGGLAVVTTSNGNLPLIIRLDVAGNVVWRSLPNIHLPNGGGSLQSAVVTNDSEVIVCGRADGDIGGGDGLWLQYAPDIQGPEIVFVRPANPDVITLRNEEVLFRVRAQDRQGDSLQYKFKLDGEVISETNEVTLDWPNTSFHEIVCTVFDDQYSDSVTWHVTVTDLYVSAFTPDTLDLAIRRGTSVDFSLDTIRYTDGAEPEILWTKTNLSNGQAEETGRDAGATITFPWSGEYSVEGRVSRGESSDAVTWHVDVKGAIWAFIPVADSLEVLPDSVVHFEVVPSAPEDESLEVAWLIDGELVREGELALDWAFGEADSSADLNRHYLVQCVVADSVEADTVKWVVTVNELGVGNDKEVGNPGRVALLSVSPNPFNSTLTIRYATGGLETAATRLGIYDIAGREMANLPGSTGVSAGRGFHPVSADRRFHPATEGGATEHQITWDASSVPAGVYFVRLQAGSIVSTKKVVLMR